MDEWMDGAREGANGRMVVVELIVLSSATTAAELLATSQILASVG